MGDVVAVAASLLLDDHLGVPHDEAAEEEETAPQVSLENENTFQLSVGRARERHKRKPWLMGKPLP